MEGLEAVDDGGGVAMLSDLADGTGDACAIDATDGVEGRACGGVCEYGKGGVGMFGRIIGPGWYWCGCGCEETMTGACCCCGGGIGGAW